jgi:DNA-binding transcriptional LysR family regulator
MLNATRLRVLREVVRRGSFSDAATALHMTQPAVSRHVARLERETRTRLLERTPRAVRPTEAGRVLAGHADEVVAALEAAEASLREVLGLRRGAVRVTSFPTAAAALVLPALAALRRANPELDVVFADASSSDGLQLVRDGEADVALCFRGPFDELDAAGLELVHLLDDPMFVALPSSHRLARRRRVRLEDLSQEGWIVGATSQLTRRACIAAGYEPHVVTRSDHTAVSQGMVAAGLGVTLLTGLGLPRARRDLAVRPLEEPIVRRVSAGVLPGRPRPPAVEELLRLLETRARRVNAATVSR